MVSSSSQPRPIPGIILDRNRKAVLQALQAGRQSGLRAGYEVIEQLGRELNATQHELARLRRRYEMAREIIRRSDVLLAQQERADGNATLH
jgi:hypothetical protein